MNPMWTALKIGVVIILLAAIAMGVWLWRDMQAELHSPMALQETERFMVKPGMNLRTITGEMVTRGWVEHPHYLLFYARLHDRSGHIQAGEYAVQPGTTPVHLLEQMISGRVMQHALTIVEGWTYQDLLRAIREHPELEQTLDPDLADDPIALMHALGLPNSHPEGLFLPDTYHFPSGTTDVALLKRAHRAMQKVLAAEWRERGQDLPYSSSYDAMIMASIIEKETAVPAERGEIAGVFSRRLKTGMKLQTDPTIIYGLGREYIGNIRRTHLQLDSPYNTYVRAGLPPTPIALPGRESIHAALHPAQGKTLYFVSRGDGSHYFSETLAEHNRAVSKYQLGHDDIQLKNE